jgi:hypothetical protein
VLKDVPRWREWWRGVVRAELLHPGAGESMVGCCYRVAWRSRIPYTLEFDFTVERVDEPMLMEGSAHGDLEGRGRWRLLEERGVSAIVYEWEVNTSKRWMNAVAPFARPVFSYNHDVVMGWGGEGLARELGTRLVASG